MPPALEAHNLNHWTTREIPDSSLLKAKNGASQAALVVKNPPASAGDIRGVGSTPGSGGSPEGGHDSTLQYSFLEKPMDRGAWQAAVHGVTKSWT